MESARNRPVIHPSRQIQADESGQRVRCAEVVQTLCSFGFRRHNWM
jgi:hypothetical protein